LPVLTLSALRDRRMHRLVERSRAGDARAFRRLYRELYPAIEAYVERRVGGLADAEDLVARTFEKFVAGLDRYDPSRGSARMWCFAIARNLIIDHHRSSTRLHPTDPAILDRDPGRPGDGPLDRLLRDEHTAQLLALIQALPADRRELLALRFGEGLSTREIAELLGLGEAAVRQRLSRICRDLERRASEPSPTRGATDALS
jgi:RNA polymerase sigma-70 factor, ECF subfamily